MLAARQLFLWRSAMTTTGRMLGVTLLAAGVLAGPAPAADAGPSAKEMQAVLDKAIAYLKTKQKPDGSFAPELGGPGVTAMVVAGLIRNGVGADDPLVVQALTALEKSVKEDGGIYNK